LHEPLRVRRREARNEPRGNSESIEESGRFLQVDDAPDHGVTNARHRKLDCGGIFGSRQLQGSESQVRLLADRVELGMVVTEMGVLEGRRLTAKPIGLDVSA